MIQLTDVSKSFGTTKILKHVNLKVAEGEFICIRGKSGVGKSTLLKIMGFLDSPDEGRVELDGKVVNDLGDSEKSHLRLHNIGFVFQFFNLIPSLTVLENIELPMALASVSKSKRKERALELINYFELSCLAQRFPDTLSGGERQRVAVIRALANKPKILLLDEPTGNLDTATGKEIMKICHCASKQNGQTVLAVTHASYVKEFTDRLLYMQDGKIQTNPVDPIN